MTTTPDQILAQGRALLEARITTCRIYAEPTATTLTLQNTVVVSSLWNRRGAYRRADGALVVGPFERGMPTLWSPADAARIVEGFQPESGETLRAVHERDWWAVELADARAALDVLPTA